MLTLDAPWLDWDLGAEMPVISWALNRPGIVTARHITWRQVTNADLPPGMDVLAWLKGELAARGRADAVAFLTSRNVTVHHTAEATEGHHHRPGRRHRWPLQRRTHRQRGWIIRAATGARSTSRFALTWAWIKASPRPP